MLFPIRSWMALALCVLAPAESAHAQNGYDRRGGDYLRFEIHNGDPAACAMRCEQDARCHAWSFSYPRTENSSAACWLKNRVAPRVEDKCCITGVRGAGIVAPRRGPVEYSIDRSGGDYRSFEVPAEQAGGACLAACTADNKCRAWTYVRAGYISPTARCYLKEKITPPRQRPCCISGVVR